MPDYSKMTDAELDAELARTAPAAKGYESMSDAELDAALAAKPAAVGPSVVQEMHPEFTNVDRFVVKNLATNNEAAVNYLQKKHPNLEVSIHDKSGQILARDRAGKELEYRVLDPEGITSPKELLRDVGDVTYEAISAPVVGAATALGGTAGLALGPGGALAGGAAAGGLASGGLETLRQLGAGVVGLGQNYGDAAKDVALATGAGALSPLLMGTGATGLKGSAQLAQRGGIGRAVDAYVKPFMKNVASKLSGISKTAIEGMAELGDDIARIEKDPMGHTKMAEGIAKKTGDVLRTNKQAAWGEFQDAVAAIPKDVEVDVSAARAVFKSKIQEAVEAEDQELVDALQSQYKKLFTRKVEVDDVAPVLTPTGEPMVDLVTGQPTMEAVKTTKMVEVDSLPIKQALNADRRLGAAAGFDKLKPGNIKGGVGNRYAQADTYIDKTIMETSAAAKSELGKALEGVLPPDALAARARYGEIANLEKSTKPLMKSSESLMKTMRNLADKANITRQEDFSKTDKEFGTDLIRGAKLSQALHVFSNPQLLPLSSQGVSGAIRGGAATSLGMAAGYGIGGLSGDRYAGAALGGLLAGSLTSPAALRQYITQGARMGRGIQAAGGLRPGAAYSTWQLMQGEKKK